MQTLGVALGFVGNYAPRGLSPQTGGMPAILRKVMSGWDITDYGTGRYREIGCVLFTVRNGNLYDPTVGCPYCEKYLLFKEGQRLPVHYHILKTEDIINRAGGGDMEVTLYNMKPDGTVDPASDVIYYSDGVQEIAKARG